MMCFRMKMILEVPQVLVRDRSLELATLCLGWYLMRRKRFHPQKNNMFVSGPECSEPAVGKNTVPYIATMDNLPDFDNFRCGDYGISRGLPSMDDLPDFDNIRCGDYGLSRGLPSSVPPSQMYPFESDAKMSRGHTNC